MRRACAGAQGHRGLPDGPLRTVDGAGVAVHQPGEDVDSIVRRADDAMYAAKAAGRDRVQVAAPHAA